MTAEEFLRGRNGNILLWPRELIIETMEAYATQFSEQSHKAELEEAIEIMKSMKLAYAIYPEKIKAFIKKHHKE